jgi:glyoxylase-like metal-dependent hydrolase (beta-lactamase superfamily II)
LITRVVNDEVRANTYVCETSSDGDALVVDPGLSIGAIEEELERRGMRPRWVLLTHGHFDHMGSAALLQQRHGATVTVHKGDRKIAKAANFLMMAAGFEQRIALPEFTVVDGPESEVDISEERAVFLHTPGHTPGSCCIAWRDALFTGDTVYRSKIGNGDFPGEDPEQLRASVDGLEGRVAEDTRILPGHGEPGTWGEVRAAIANPA